MGQSKPTRKQSQAAHNELEDAEEASTTVSREMQTQVTLAVYKDLGRNQPGNHLRDGI